jgi:hypothetical protein
LRQTRRNRRASAPPTAENGDGRQRRVLGPGQLLPM